MAIQFSKLKTDIEKLGEATAKRQDKFGEQIELLFALMEKIGTDGGILQESVDHIVATGKMNERDYRGALPLVENCAINEGIDVPEIRPQQGTLIAVDGSQAIPSRHDGYQYYLLNVGWIIYRLGRDSAPEVDSEPALFYPGDNKNDGINWQQFESAKVNIERDKLEMQTLAKVSWENRNDAAPIIAIMDQRLQYWPIGLQEKGSQKYVQDWVEEMRSIEDCGALLVGYIERPETSAIVTMLNTYHYTHADGPEYMINRRPEIADVALYRRLLKSGQRSCVYKVFNLSRQYEPFEQGDQEICFFYFKPPGVGDVTRIDLPLWVAEKPGIVAQIHAMLYDQCLKLNGYPFVLTRADELAVVRATDKNVLEMMIAQEMGRNGSLGQQTAKQIGKNLTRAGRRRR